MQIDVRWKGHVFMKPRVTFMSSFPQVCKIVGLSGGGGLFAGAFLLLTETNLCALRGSDRNPSPALSTRSEARRSTTLHN